MRHCLIRRCFCAVMAALTVSAIAPVAYAQFRVATWNVTNYSAGRVNEFGTAIYGVFEGRSLAPDILIGQEFLSASGVTNFLNILNTATGSPGDWAAAPFSNGNDTDNAFFYRTTRVDFLGMTVVAVGSGPPNHPRDVNRYDVRLKGYTADDAILACYSSHMKAGSGSDDQARRLLEAQAIRTDAESLPLTWKFVLGGDFNIQSSNQLAYGEMTNSQANNDGRLFDPISTPGSWNNNGSFRFVHTQDPAGAGGMDDRHDQLLACADLLDGDGFDYIGDPTFPYSTTDWDDPNHSYRSWGNDGTSFNVGMTIAGNTMVGATIAQALVTSAVSGGHLPVVMNMRVPSEITSDTIIDFGQVAMDSSAMLNLTVANDGDVALWTAAGVDTLDYMLTAPAGFTAPAGAFTDDAGGASNMHIITMDTSSPGVMSGFLTINSDAPDEPVRLVMLMGEVINACTGDLDGDGNVGSADFALILGAWGNPGGVEDLDGDGNVGSGDLAFLLGQWGACP